ncbi:pentapeptide repeat-containing protein [Clostridium baratii]|uniref:pentapeptide repeat-containing protein n=1 Tax=Clostridium baratii TaxID=1561 RepID=UPI0030CF0F0F
MQDLKKDYELFKVYDSNGKKELAAVKSLLNENRDIESLYPYEAANGIFETGGYRRQIHYYEQSRFAEIVDTKYTGTYEVDTYSEFKENKEYKEYREKLIEKLVNDREFLDFKDKNKDKVLVSVLNAEDLNYLGYYIDNVHELTNINKQLNYVNDDFIRFNTEGSIELKIDALKEDSFNLDINLGIEKDIDIIKEIEKSSDEKAIKFIENYKAEINKKEAEKENLIKELEINIENLDTPKGGSIRPFFEDTFDIEKIKQEIESKGIEKVAKDLKDFVLWSGVEGEYNNSVVLAKDYIKDDIVKEAVEKAKQEAIIKKINSIMDEREQDREFFKVEIKNIAFALKEYRNDFLDKSFVEKLSDYLDRYIEKVKDIIEKVKDNFEKDSLEKESILDKHLNLNGLTKENKEREISSYLESKGILNDTVKESLKNNSEFLNLLEEKILLETEINFIKENIRVLPAEYMDLDNEGYTVSYVGSEQYNNAKAKLENDLLNEENKLIENDEALRSIVDKEVLSNSFGDKKESLLLRLKDNEKFNELLVEKVEKEVEILFTNSNEEKIEIERELKSIKKEINKEIEKERGIFLNGKTIEKDLNKILNADKKEITQQEIDEMIEYHEEWIETGGLAGEQLDLEGKELKGLRLLNVDLENANLKDTVIKDCAIFANLKGANFEGSKIDNVEFIGSNINGVKMESENLRGVKAQINSNEELHKEINSTLKTNKDKEHKKEKTKESEYEM